MSSLTQHPKFLLDENVRTDLIKFLKRGGIDAKFSPKSASDSDVASITKKESRVLVTNDEDFSHYGPNDILAVIWLRIPQSDAQVLITAFKKLLESKISYPGKLIILNPTNWEELSLGEIKGH